MSVIIRLQNLPWSADALDIRRFFNSLSIPDGGVHIVGGEKGDAFIAFSTDEDARKALLLNGKSLMNMPITLMLSSKTEMYSIINRARGEPAATSTPKVDTTIVRQISTQPFSSTQLLANKNPHTFNRHVGAPPAQQNYPSALPITPVVPMNLPPLGTLNQPLGGTGSYSSPVQPPLVGSTFAPNSQWGRGNDNLNVLSMPPLDAPPSHNGSSNRHVYNYNQPTTARIDVDYHHKGTPPESKGNRHTDQDQRRVTAGPSQQARRDSRNSVRSRSPIRRDQHRYDERPPKHDSRVDHHRNEPNKDTRDDRRYDRPRIPPREKERHGSGTWNTMDAHQNHGHYHPKTEDWTTGRQPEREHTHRDRAADKRSEHSHGHDARRQGSREWSKGRQSHHDDRNHSHHDDRNHFGEAARQADKQRHKQESKAQKKEHRKESAGYACLANVPATTSPQDICALFSFAKIVTRDVKLSPAASGGKHAFIVFHSEHDFRVAMEYREPLYREQRIVLEACSEQEYKNAPIDQDRARRTGREHVQQDYSSRKRPKNEQDRSHEREAKALKWEEEPYRDSRRHHDDYQDKKRADEYHREHDRHEWAEHYEAPPPAEDSRRVVLKEDSPDRPKFECVMVRNLPPSAEKKNLMDFFAPLRMGQFGCYIEFDSHGNAMGDAFFHFRTHEEYQDAILMHKQQLMGQEIEIYPLTLDDMKSRVSNHKRQYKREKPSKGQRVHTGYPDETRGWDERERHDASKNQRDSAYPERHDPEYITERDYHRTERRETRNDKSSTIVRVSNLPAECVLEDVLHLMAEFRPLRKQSTMAYDKHGRPSTECNIAFGTYRAAKSAVDAFDGQSFKRSRLILLLLEGGQRR